MDAGDCGHNVRQLILPVSGYERNSCRHGICDLDRNRRHRNISGRHDSLQGTRHISTHHVHIVHCHRHRRHTSDSGALNVKYSKQETFMGISDDRRNHGDCLGSINEIL